MVLVVGLALAVASPAFAQECESGDAGLDVVWPAFADQATQIAQSLGLADEQLPGVWLRKQAFLARAGRTGRRGTS